MQSAVLLILVLCLIVLAPPCHEPRHGKTGFLHMRKQRRRSASQISFAIRIVQSLYFLNPKFQASSLHLWMYSSVCVVPGRKPRRPVFSERGSRSVALLDSPYPSINLSLSLSLSLSFVLFCHSVLLSFSLNILKTNGQTLTKF